MLRRREEPEQFRGRITQRKKYSFQVFVHETRFFHSQLVIDTTAFVKSPLNLLLKT